MLAEGEWRAAAVTAAIAREAASLVDGGPGNVRVPGLADRLFARFPVRPPFDVLAAAIQRDAGFLRAMDRLAQALANLQTASGLDPKPRRVRPPRRTIQRMLVAEDAITPRPLRRLGSSVSVCGERGRPGS